MRNLVKRGVGSVTVALLCALRVPGPDGFQHARVVHVVRASEHAAVVHGRNAMRGGDEPTPHNVTCTARMETSPGALSMCVCVYVCVLREKEGTGNQISNRHLGDTDGVARTDAKHP